MADQCVCACVCVCVCVFGTSIGMPQAHNGWPTCVRVCLGPRSESHRHTMADQCVCWDLDQKATGTQWLTNVCVGTSIGMPQAHNG